MLGGAALTFVIILIVILAVLIVRALFRLEEEAIHCGKLRIFQWAPSMISADVLSENIDFPFELFVFAAVFIDLQLCLGGIFQILGQLAADVIGIESLFS